MIYVLAIFVPPVALLIVNRPGQAILNVPLWFLCTPVAAAIHACVVVGQAKAEERDQQQRRDADRRHRQTIDALTASRQPPPQRRRRREEEVDDLEYDD